MRLPFGVALTAVLPFVASAKIDVDPSSTTVVPGQWCGNFAAAKSYSEQHDIPLVMIWGNYATKGTHIGECTNCKALTDALKTTSGSAWVSQQNAVFCFVEGRDFKDVSPNSGAIEFAGGTKGVYEGEKLPYLDASPFVRFYWKGHNDCRFSGVLNQMYSKTGSDLLTQFENSFALFLSEAGSGGGGGDDPDPGDDPDLGDDPVVGGSGPFFPMSDRPCDRLEAVVGVTTYVDIPIWRTNGTDSVETYYLTCDPVLSGKLVWGDSIPLEWEKGETQKFVRYELLDDFAVGDRIELSIWEDVEVAIVPVTVRSVWCVSPGANSPKNPHWIGEKTADTLNWGEWSMDIGVVTNKVKSWNRTHPNDRAYAMMFVGGSTWCPDCAMAEANFFSKQEFKDWAAERKVVFGVLDIPNNPQATEAFPSQLRYESYRTSDAYVTLRGTASADERERYQSGAGYLSRHSVPYEQAREVSVRNAFLMGHDTLHGGWNRPERENKNRTGVPVLLLLRDDGTIAARWNRFSDVGPAAYSDGYLRRFDEMLAQVGDTHEEADDDCSTTQRTIQDGDAPAGSVSAVDQADVYRIVGAEANDQVTLTVNGDAPSLRISVIDANRDEVASTAGSAAGGLSLSTQIGSGDFFVKIAPETVADGTFFGFTNKVSTVCNYTVAFSCRGDGGEIGFVRRTVNVDENCGTVALAVTRANGKSGPASVKVRLTDKSGTDVARRIGWTDKTLTWAHGEAGEKTATLTINDDSDVNGGLVLDFSLTDLSGEAEDLSISSGSMRVNVLDDDVFGTRLFRDVAAPADVRNVPNYRSGDEVVITLKSGALPEGLSLVAENGSVRTVGTVRAPAGEYSAEYTVTLKRGGGTVSSTVMTFEYTVVDYDFAGDFPSLATMRTYGNLPFVDGGRVKGVLRVTVRSDGALSAKYLTAGKSFSYSADGWSSFDVKTGVLTAVLAARFEGGGAMTVTFDPTAGGRASLPDPSANRTLAFDLPLNAWPNGASAWAGQYTVQLPQTNAVDGCGFARLTGTAAMTLRMTDSAAIASGTMTYVAFLPNGRTVSGSSMLIDNGDGTASLPFYEFSDLQTSPFVFAGGLRIEKNAAANYRTTRWSVSEDWAPTLEIRDGYERMSVFGVFGGYYDKDEIKIRFDEDFSGKTDSFTFIADTASIRSGRYGSGRSMDPIGAEVTSSNVPRLLPGGENPQKVELDFSAETGVIRGTFAFPFADGDTAVTFHGVVLPGWQGCSTCSRGDSTERPWAAGSCSFSDRTRDAGVFRNGCEIRMDAAEGEGAE